MGLVLTHRIGEGVDIETPEGFIQVVVNGIYYDDLGRKKAKIRVSEFPDGKLLPPAWIDEEAYLSQRENYVIGSLSIKLGLQKNTGAEQVKIDYCQSERKLYPILRFPRDL